MPSYIVSDIIGAVYAYYQPGPGCSNVRYRYDRINYYPADKYYKNQLRYSVDRDLSGG